MLQLVLQPAFQRNKISLELGQGVIQGNDRICQLEYVRQSGGHHIYTGVEPAAEYVLRPVVNAARGIAVQAQTAIGQFSSNFQTALNPQIPNRTRPAIWNTCMA